MLTLSGIMLALLPIMLALLVKGHGQNAEGTVTKPTRDSDKCLKGRTGNLALSYLRGEWKARPQRSSIVGGNCKNGGFIETALVAMWTGVLQLLPSQRDVRDIWDIRDGGRGYPSANSRLRSNVEGCDRPCLPSIRQPWPSSRL